jgi:hypothetical protein
MKIRSAALALAAAAALLAGCGGNPQMTLRDYFDRG